MTNTDSTVEESPQEAVPPRNLWQRIHAVMRDVEYLRKTDKHYDGFMFVSHDRVCGVLRKAMVEHGIVFAVSVVEHNVEAFQNDRGKRTYFCWVRIEGTITNIDNPTESLTSTMVGYGEDRKETVVGIALSYGVKNLLLKTFMLETGLDADRVHAPDGDTQDTTPVAQPHQEEPPAQKTRARRTTETATAPVPQPNKQAAEAAICDAYKKDLMKVIDGTPFTKNDVADALKHLYGATKLVDAGHTNALTFLRGVKDQMQLWRELQLAMETRMGEHADAAQVVDAARELLVQAAPNGKPMRMSADQWRAVIAESIAAPEAL